MSAIMPPMTLTKWMRQADIDEGTKPGRSTGESGELREARRRIKLLERDSEVLVVQGSFDHL